MSMNAASRTPGTAAEFVAAIRSHENFVLRRPGGKRADLKFAHIPGVNLSNRRLSEIELSGANLQGANLTSADLDNAYLFCTNLSKANLNRASLNKADMRGACVQGASFEFAEMNGVDFRQSTIAVTDFDSKWTVPGRSPGSSSAVSFENCSLKGAKLQNANLKGANFNGAVLNDACFSGATLGDASFDGAVLIGVNIKELRLPAERFKNAIVDPGPEQKSRLPHFVAILESAQLWVETNGRQGAAANLEGEDIRLLAQMMKNRKLTGIKCTNTLAVDADFSACELQAANFDGADLRCASFAGADLRGASFRRANLAHADFSGANLLPLELKNGVVLTTSFEGTKLDRTNFTDASR